jgi:hypothetical protein
MVQVKPAITDGTKTQVTGDVAEGMEIIIGKTGPAATNAAPTASPFQGQQQQQRGPRGPGGF